MPSAELSVVLVTNSYFPADQEGGPPFSNYELAQAMARAGARLTVLSTDRNGSARLDVPLDRWVNVDDTRVFYARTRRGTWLRSPGFGRAAAQAIRSADVCIMSAVFWSYTGLVAWLACRRYRVPYVSYARGFLSPWALGEKSLKKALYWSLIGRRMMNGSSALVALAQQELDDYLRMRLTPSITVIPNGAPVVDETSIGAIKPAASVSIAANSYFLFLGRVHSKKGLDLLLPALDLCIKDGCDARLVIAGPVDPSYRSEFSRLLADCEARDRVDEIGTVSGHAKSALIRGARAFVLPSYSEGLPVAALEAMSMGIPAIITAQCNLPEVAAARAGVIAELEARSIAEAMMRVWSDPLLRRELSENARRLTRERFSWDSVGTQVATLCRNVATSGGSHVT